MPKSPALAIALPGARFLRMRSVHPFTLSLAVVLAGGLACGTADEAEEAGPASAPAPLRGIETFRWSTQPIAFALPPDGWRREITNQGGLLGVGFVKEGSVGEVIEIAEYMALARRGRCEKLREMLERFDDLDPAEFARAIQKAKLYASPAINHAEQRVVRQANETLDRAGSAFRAGDRDQARLQLEIAAREADRLHYELDEVVERVLFAPKNLPRYIQVDVGQPESAEFKGKPALRQSYKLQDSDRVFAGRRLYFMRGPHLFVAAFQGLEQNVPLFERILATVEYPPRDCEP